MNFKYEINNLESPYFEGLNEDDKLFLQKYLLKVNINLLYDIKYVENVFHFIRYFYSRTLLDNDKILYLFNNPENSEHIFSMLANNIENIINKYDEFLYIHLDNLQNSLSTIDCQAELTLMFLNNEIYLTVEYFITELNKELSLNTKINILRNINNGNNG